MKYVQKIINEPKFIRVRKKLINFNYSFSNIFERINKFVLRFIIYFINFFASLIYLKELNLSRKLKYKLCINKKRKRQTQSI